MTPPKHHGYYSLLTLTGLTWRLPEAAVSGGERYGNRTPNERELRIIELVAQGLTNSEIAAATGTSQHVVKNYLCIIYDKLGLWNRVELALWYEARKHGERTMN